MMCYMIYCVHLLSLMLSNLLYSLFLSIFFYSKFIYSKMEFTTNKCYTDFQEVHLIPLRNGFVRLLQHYQSFCDLHNIKYVKNTNSCFWIKYLLQLVIVVKRFAIWIHIHIGNDVNILSVEVGKFYMLFIQEKYMYNMCYICFFLLKKNLCANVAKSKKHIRYISKWSS